MKKITFLKFVFIVFTFLTFNQYAQDESKIDFESCTFKGFSLNGKIQFVESFPDDCCEWQIVNSFPDVKNCPLRRRFSEASRIISRNTLKLKMNYVTLSLSKCDRHPSTGSG